MSRKPEACCEEPANAGFVSDLVWRALRYGGAIARRRDGELWQFATGQAEVKVDGSLLSPLHHGMILGQMAVHPCLRWADLWVPVPNGMNGDVAELGVMYGHSWTADMVRPDRSKLYEFVPTDDEQVAKIENAHRLTLLEDISTTGSTAAYLAKMLRGINPTLEIHSLSWLQRNMVRPEFTQGENAVNYHTLCRMDVPTEHAAFVDTFGFEPVLV